MNTSTNIESSVVSIVIPCFNNGGTIAQTLDSVITQTIPNWEVICVDDGSTDNTIEIINTYVKRDERIRLMVRSSEPKGGSHCRNIGASLAKGEFLIFLDGDDILANTCVENRLRSIVDTTYDFVVFPMGFFNGTNPQRSLFAGTQLKKEVNYLYYYASGCAGWTITSPIIKKEFFQSLGGFDVAFPRLQDIEFNLRAIIKSQNKFNLMYNEDYDCYYRFGGTVSSSMSSKLYNALLSYEKFLDLIIRADVDGVFLNRILLSKAVLNIFCNAFIQYDILKIKYSYDGTPPGWLISNSIPMLFRRKESIVLSFLQKSVSFVYFNYILSRVISFFIRKSFK